MNDNLTVKIPVNNIKLSSIFSKRKIATDGHCEGPIYNRNYRTTTTTRLLTDRASNKTMDPYIIIGTERRQYNYNYDEQRSFDYDCSMMRVLSDDPFMNQFEDSYGDGTEYGAELVEDIHFRQHICRKKYLNRNISPASKLYDKWI